MSSVIRGSDDFDSAEVIGQNQTWQDVSGSRAANVTYTNSTGLPIQVLIGVQANNFISVLTVDGIANNVGSNAGGVIVTGSITAIVPDGSTYILNSGSTIVTWTELR